MRLAVMIFGVIFTLWTVLAIVRAMLVPNGSKTIIGSVVSGTVRAIGYAPLRLFKSYEIQNRWLASLAPISLLFQLVTYVTILIISTGFVVYGSTSLSMVDSLYQSGSTLTTLGIVEPVNTASAITVMVGAFLGLVVIAIFIGYLLALYGSIVRRESMMARLSVLAGEPAWGPEILARGHILEMPSENAPRCEDWIDWVCDLRLNQRVNPVLAEFRSTAEHRHWVVSLLAVMDAVALRMAILGKPQPLGIELLTSGGIALSLFNGKTLENRNWALQARIKDAFDNNGPTQEEPQLTNEEWEAGISALTLAGFPLPEDLASVRLRFMRIRSTYESNAYDLASRYHAVPAPWSGERKPMLELMWPLLAESEKK